MDEEEESDNIKQSTSDSNKAVDDNIDLSIDHSCTVDELKSVIESSQDDPCLLNLVQQANVKQRNRPSSFFCFPGTRGSMISLPPFQKWPLQMGWSFSTWLLLDSKPCSQPYLYNFKTGKSGLGYSAHFTGNCLVLTSIRVKGKGVQHCVVYEFPSNKWIHCAITFHNKWRASEVRIYVNGQLLPTIEISWQVQTSEIFDKCFIGGSGTITNADRTGELNSFCGQMSAIYLFNEGLSAAQICAIHRLGPSYMGQFRYSNESVVDLPPMISKSLYDGKLAASLFCLYSPVAVDQDTLCIQLAPIRSSTTTPATNYFLSAPHAALLGETKAINTQPICSTIQSIGCSSSLLPLLDHFANTNQSEACAFLIAFLCDLLECSPHWFANEIVQNNGFVMVACSLARNPKQLLSDRILDIFLNLSRSLITAASPTTGSLLLKHLMDNILFNPSLWIYADTNLQIKLYSYLSNEFLNGTRRTTSNKYTISSSGLDQSTSATGNTTNSYIPYNPTSSASIAVQNHLARDEDQGPLITITDIFFGEIRRVSTVLQSLHALKYHYWIEEEKNIIVKARNINLRPSRTDLYNIRSHILQYMSELIIRSNSIPLDETQGILNYLATCNCPENLTDVLDTLFNLIAEHPTHMVPALDQKQASKVIYGLLSSECELIRVRSLRLLTLYLSKLSNKRKQEMMGPNNLFMLLCDKLKVYLPLTSDTYEALVDLMLERMEPEDRDLRKKRIENSILIKVIATLLREEFTNNEVKSPGTSVGSEIRSRFINDLWSLIVNSRENRRIILQMSVWQHWLINLIGNTITDSQLVRDQVLAIFRVLLYHATRYEYGGWRVWIDTLAIIHTKVSLDEFLINHTSPALSPEPINSHEQLESEYQPEEQKITEDESLDKHSLCKPDANDIEQSSSKESVGCGAKSEEDDDGDTETSAVVKKLEDNQTNEESNNNGQQINDDTNQRVEGEQVNAETLPVEDKEELVHSKETSSENTTEYHKGDATNEVDESISDAKVSVDEPKIVSSICDSVDLAPSRAYRKLRLPDDSAKVAGETTPTTSQAKSESPCDSSPQTMTSIPLDDDSTEGGTTPEKITRPLEMTGETSRISESLKAEVIKLSRPVERVESNAPKQQTTAGSNNQSTTNKATASPAFRIPEFRWTPVLIKLLNDLIFSIECDLYNWRCSGNCMNMELGPFVPRSSAGAATTSSSVSASNQTSSGPHSSGRNQSGTSTTAATSFFEQILQRPENQVYIVNIIHFISQLCDNIIISAGGLLPLLAEATGGNRTSSSSSAPSSPDEEMSSKSARSSPAPDLLKLNEICEGLMMKQANSLLYRLMNMVDVVILAASHINLSELEAEKNSTSGSILRQCLRLASTVTVKNCLVIRSLSNRLQSNSKQPVGELTEVEFPKDFFDSYQGCSLLSANNLFPTSNSKSLEDSDLVANVEYSSNQTPNSSSMPSLLPFQCNPIKDGNKLLQSIDVARIQACIYLNTNLESRESQFLALSSLYFISVLMVSKYRDIIEPKTQHESSHSLKDSNANMIGGTVQGKPFNNTKSIESAEPKPTSGRSSPTTSAQSLDSGIQNSGTVSAATSSSTATTTTSTITTATTTTQSVSTTDATESNLLNFGRLQPTINGPNSRTPGNNLTDILTGRLENTLDVVCPLLKSIMCDFCSFLSRTLVGSHGQDLVNKEADRTFKRTNTSPVGLVMLLCSQEWQNTLQKNAGLAFIELINEGRMTSIGMKEHIVRVAMEAEFILSRLRADDVTKHEHFQVASAELHESRLNEEMLINNLISSASRRDFAIYRKFRDAQQLKQSGSNHDLKLDIWEDDDRRMRRFVMDSYKNQQLYKPIKDDDRSVAREKSSDKVSADVDSNLDKQRILELHESHDMSTLKVNYDSDAGANQSLDHHRMHGGLIVGGGRGRGHDELDMDNGDEDDDYIGNEEDDGLNSDDIDSDNDGKHQSQAVDEVECGPVIGDRKQDASGGRYKQKSTYTTSYRRQQQHQQQNRRRKMANNEMSALDQHQSWLNDAERNNSTTSGGCGEVSGAAIYGADCSLIWSIYSIPGVLSLSHNELYFEPNQNINEVLEALKRNPDDDHELIIENLIPAPDPDNLASHYQPHLVYLKSSISSSGNNTANAATSSNDHHTNNNNHHQHQTFIKTYTTLRKSDLRVLRYCDFLTGNAKIALSDIRAIFSRHYLLQPQALEIFVAQRTSVMFNFLEAEAMRRMVRYLPPVGVGIKYGIPQSRRASIMSGRQLFEASNMTQKWQRREIGNFQYLMFLNTIAGRSYQDLNQYPVFPWILTNYDDLELDLTLPANFRDLTKPVGALNSKRRQEFIERYQTWDTPKVPAFHYGTHYSTAAFTLNWLCRIRGNPQQAYLALHDGSYENESRLFTSVQDSWLSSLTSGQQNVKELIPEFFYLPEMFHSNLGLPPVELPPWAKSPEHFVRIHRLALESELVSCQLHQWIDLIFGYKQRGPEAVSAINTFYYLTYQGNVNLNMIQEPALREAIETQIRHFGQTPAQLTTEPHPPRFSPLHVSPSVFSPTNSDELTTAVKFPFNNAIVHVAACVDMSQRAPGSGHSESAGSSVGTIPNSSTTNGIHSILTITANNQFQINDWTQPNASEQQVGSANAPAASNQIHSSHHATPTMPIFTMDPQIEGSSKRQLIDVDDLCSSIALRLDQPTDKRSSLNHSSAIKTRVSWPNAHFVVTIDGRFIIMGSFYDNSFRVFSTANGKLCQVIYGHRGPLTCMARSEGNANADFSLATGSQDCSLLLWTWNERYAQVEGSGVSAVHNPLPKLSISGHRTPVLSAMICIELGIIISGSKNLILANTTTNGETLLNIDVSLPRLLERSSHRLQAKLAETENNKDKQLDDDDSSKAASQDDYHPSRPHVADKEKSLLEASMMGDTGRLPPPASTSSRSTQDKAARSSMSPSTDSLNASLEKFAHLRSLCQSDYYITNIRFARELGYIVILALPPPRETKKQQHQQEAEVTTKSPSALLMTFNLKGDLMECSTIGQSLNGPRLGDTSLLQTTRDGEHLILNDSPSTLKIVRTFDLQPIYAFNTNDLPPFDKPSVVSGSKASTSISNNNNTNSSSGPNNSTNLESLPQTNNRVRSLLVLDHRFLVVGMENGKLAIYNADFKHFE